jgi:predicted dehydrogenase
VQDLKIAVVGAGLIGRVHVETVCASRECSLHSIVDPSPDAADLARRYAVAHHVSLDELFLADRPDALIVATPNHLHVQQACQCLALGLPVLLEKPVATSAAEGERLLAEVRRMAVPVLVGHHRAHGQIMARACEIVRSGRLGRLVTLMGSAVFYKPDEYFASAPWRTQAGGGPILINLIHEVHNLRMLMGEISSVQAFSSNAIRGFEVEDTVAISLRFTSGALGSFVLSDTAACARSWEQSAAENPAYAHDAQADCYIVAGTRGSLSIPTLKLDYYPPETAASWWQPFSQERCSVDRVDPLKSQLAHFARVIRGEAEPLVSVADGLANLRVIEAIIEAAETGCSVELP